MGVGELPFFYSPKSTPIKRYLAWSFLCLGPMHASVHRQATFLERVQEGDVGWDRSDVEIALGSRSYCRGAGI
jgi:hypothetical protein